LVALPCGSSTVKRPPPNAFPAYSILVLTCASFLVGVLWVRTRNLLLLMFVHASVDLLPNYVETVHAFGLDR
jgi:membrane protease YdiL (CAAX protease family)